MGDREQVLVDASTLRRELDAGEGPALLDVRWDLGDPDGREHYRAGHLPGAVFVDLDTELSAPATPAEGRHPLPAIEDLQAAARRWGLTTGRPVVVYDNTGGRAAARAWWLLRWAGHPAVRLLDGGLAAWLDAGYATESGEVVEPPGDIVLRAGQLPTITADDAAGWAGQGVLLDARAGERYRGEVEPVDPRAGHIPGALSAPTADNLNANGTFRSTPELVAHFARLGVRPGTEVAAYCGSGVTAAQDIAALAAIGIDAALYAGSWSAWSADPARATALGPEPV